MATIRLFGNAHHCLDRTSSTFSKMAARAGHPIVTEGDNWDVGIIWFPWGEFFVTTEQRKVARKRRIINDTHLTYLKSSVMRNCEKAFGIPFEIDPLTHEGPAVEKPDDYNGTHAGQIVTCPIEARVPGKVYQRVIDNTAPDRMVLDLRISVVGLDLPLVWKKYRPVETRFSNTNAHCELKEVDEVFSKDEISRIRRFVFRAGLEWGELDILRDNASGQIYIVDLNNTPMGPPNGCRPEEGSHAIDLLCDAFAANFV